jgi:2,4-dienoyl-CoA reductase-like NADH-dependent reductase (Old Yellow Enzyme family)
MQPYQEKYPHLFAPITVRGKSIKNRIIMAPHGRTHAIMQSSGDNTAILSMEGVEY